ncbi:TPA: hypothetical protein NNU74_004514 [Salmonella enterica]|nr:hypothetical protein [Salmonella enterica]HCH8436872.1 hypothetical protein [Salmonella enterica]HCH9029262.1 hypothetical protein [Salmonella enterica]HCH9129497.1 hypothetical protein [Salmonella enterica]HCH9332840.1 hypothetical protein [Salmonella enterica]
MEPTTKQLQDTIAQLKEALVNWNYVASQDGVPIQLPMTKVMVDAKSGLCFAFFMYYPTHFVDDMWRHLKNPEGSYLFPVGGGAEFVANPNRWANPKRKALAERCIPYLKAKLEAALLKGGDTCS